MFGMWDVGFVEYWGCGILMMSGVEDVGYPGCERLGMWDLGHVGCRRYGMLGMWDVWDV